MTLEIHSWDRHGNVAELNQLMGSLLDTCTSNWITNENTDINKR